MQQKKVLITGASSGIGAALAKELARRGAKVWLAARRANKLEALCQELGPHTHAVELDVCMLEQTAERVRALDAECGGFDIVVANAGVSYWPDAHRIDHRDAFTELQTNLSGAAATVLPLIPAMVARKRGHLVAISSLAAEIATPFTAVYGASKAGLSALFHGLRPGLKGHGVSVTVVHPGYVKSEITDAYRFPMPFIMSAERAATIIADAIEHKRAIVRFPRPLALLLTLTKLIPRILLDAMLRAHARRVAAAR